MPGATPPRRCVSAGLRATTVAGVSSSTLKDGDLVPATEGAQHSANPGAPEPLGDPVGLAPAAALQLG